MESGDGSGISEKLLKGVLKPLKVTGDNARLLYLELQFGRMHSLSLLTFYSFTHQPHSHIERCVHLRLF